MGMHLCCDKGCIASCDWELLYTATEDVLCTVIAWAISCCVLGGGGCIMRNEKACIQFGVKKIYCGVR